MISPNATTWTWVLLVLGHGVLGLGCSRTPLEIDRPPATPAAEPLPVQPVAEAAPTAGTAAPTEPPIDCRAVTVRVERVTPKVVLLVDGSSSMQDNAYPLGATTTRWDAVHTALLDPNAGVVPAMQGLMKLGLAIYGSGMLAFGGVPSAKTCPFPVDVVAPALNQGDHIARSWPAMAPGTFTPTGEALELLLQRFDSWRTESVEPEVIVLATDGNPNSCMPEQFEVPDYQPTIDAAMRAQAQGTKLFVISLGTDADRTHLQRVANIGAGLAAHAEPGAPLYYPEDVEQLASTLRNLLGNVVSCELLLDGDGVDPSQQCTGSVRLNGESVACDPQNGFRVKDRLHLELLGAACARLRALPEVTLDVTFPCDALR